PRFPGAEEGWTLGAWKARHVAAWTQGRPFVWFEDEPDAAECVAGEPDVARHLLVRIDPMTGLTDAHLASAADWLRALPSDRACRRPARVPEAEGPGTRRGGSSGAEQGREAARGDGGERSVRTSRSRSGRGRPWRGGCIRPRRPGGRLRSVAGKRKEPTMSRSPLLDLVFGYMPAQMLHAAAELRVADALAGRPRTSAELAEETGTHAPSLYRLLRGLTALGVVDQKERDLFALTAEGQRLRTGVPGSIRSLILLFCGPDVWRTWGDMTETLRTGEYAW